MGILSSKRLRELEMENEDLRNKIHVITEREESLSHLNNILRKMRSEVSELNEIKLTLSSEINFLKEESEKKRSLLDNLNTEISQLREIKHGEQDNLLNYSEQIKSLEKIISEKKLIDEQEITLVVQRTENDLADDLEKKNNLLIEIEHFEKNLKYLNNKYSEVKEKVDELSRHEEQLERLINDKKAEADNIENIRLIKAIDELRRVEEKSDILIAEQKSLVDKINIKQKEIDYLNEKFIKLTDDENKSRKILNWLQEEIADKKNKTLILETKIEELTEAETNVENKIEELLKSKEELSDQTKQHFYLKEEEQKLRDQLTALNLGIEQKKSEADELQKIVGDLNAAEIEAKQNIAELENTQNKLLKSVKRYEELKKEEESLRKSMGDLGENISQGKSESDSIIKNLELLRFEEEETQKRIDNLRIVEDELIHDIKKHYAQKKEFSELNIKIQELERELENKSCQVAEVTQRLDALKNEEENIKSKSTEIESINAELERLNTVKSHLNSEEQLQRHSLEVIKQEIDKSTREAEAIKVAVDELREIENGLRNRIDNFEEAKFEVTQLNKKLHSLKEEELLSNEKIEQLKSEISENEKIAESLRINLTQLREAEENTRKKIDALASKAKEKMDRLTKTERDIQRREEESIELENQLGLKLKEINDANLRHQKVFEQIEIKQKELVAVEENLNIKSKRLSKLSAEVSELEKKQQTLLAEINPLEELKIELHKKIILAQENFEKIQKDSQQVKELVPLLEKRKEEIERTNFELENRFTKMFRKFNVEMNEINKKRAVLEQIIKKKDQDLEEKDQLLFEKIAALEESERILSMRQAEVDSFEDLLRVIEEKKDQLQHNLLKLDSQAIERKNYNNDLKAESDLILRKKVLIEQGLEEMLGTMNNKYSDTRERRHRLDTDIKDHEEKLTGLNQKIADSMNELVELQSSICAIKVEHEEHRGQIMKLASMKKKLHEEIAKNQRILQRYQKIREKLKIEESLAKGKNEDLDLKTNIDRVAASEEKDISNIFKL